MELYSSFLVALERAVKDAGGLTAFSRLTGVPPSTITRYLSKERMPKLVQIEPMLPYIAWPLGESGEDLLAVERENAKLKLELEELRTELEKNRSRLDLMRDLLTPAKKRKPA